MKKFIPLLTLILMSSFGFAQTGPKITFKSTVNTIDYGMVSKSNDNGLRPIEFTNTGNAPLVITQVLSTPGFTIVSQPTAAIAPGKTDQIMIKYNMTPGPIRKTITVETNAVNFENGRIPIKIKGEVSQ